MFEHNIHRPGKQTSEIIANYWTNPQFKNKIFLDFSYIGISHAKKEFKFVRNDWPHMQVLACISGKGVVWVDGKWKLLKPGYAYINAPGIPSAYHITENSWELAWAIYNPSISQNFLKYIPKPIIKKIEIVPFLAVIENLCREYISDPSGTLTLQWLGLLDTYMKKIITTNCMYSNYLKDLWIDVERNLNFKWTLDSLSEKAQMSSESLRKLCIKETNLSPLRYVTRLRMRRACFLLTDTKHSIDEISKMVGYENSFAFAVAFKKYVGIPPSIYRKQEIINHQ